MLVSREWKSNGTNAFEAFHYSISPIYEQNMSSNGAYQLEEFPRKLSVCAQWDTHAISFTNEAVFDALPFNIFVDRKNIVYVDSR